MVVVVVVMVVVVVVVVPTYSGRGGQICPTGLINRPGVAGAVL